MAGGHKLSDVAKRLLTETGYLNENATLYDELKNGRLVVDPDTGLEKRVPLTRDETTSKIAAGRRLDAFRDEREERVALKKHKELVKSLSDAKEAVKDKGNGAASLTADQVQLPRKRSE